MTKTKSSKSEPLLRPIPWHGQGKYADHLEQLGMVLKHEQIAAVFVDGWNDGRLILRFPETAGCRQFFLYDDHVSSGQWDPRCGTETKDMGRWQREPTSPRMRGIVEVPDRGGFIIDLIPGYGVLELGLTMYNHSTTVMKDVFALMCLTLSEFTCFRDPGLQHTFIQTEQGLTRLAETDRQAGHFQTTMYGVEDSPPPIFWLVSWTSKYVLSLDRAITGLLLRTSPDQTRTVGIGWHPAAIIYNSFHHPCLHTDPYIGDLRPGESRHVKGRIYAVNGPPAKVMSQHRIWLEWQAAQWVTAVNPGLTPTTP